jgi:ParB-like chromosome segregation protein Spo0J
MSSSSRTEELHLMEENTIREIAVDDLYLDERNPRLPTSTGRQQKEMLLYIARNTSITELMSAIAENGYFPGEPIIVIPRSEGGYWTVEGNRRLTAVKLLLDPSLHAKNARV